MGRADITLEQLDKGVDVPTDEQHTLVVERNYAETIEIDERQFLSGSSVLLAVPEQATADRALLAMSGLSIAAHALRYAKAHSDRKLAILAHDSDKDAGRALTTSQRRAQNVLAVLTGDKALFASSVFHTGTATPLSLLRWAAMRFGYDCEPARGAKNALAEAVRGFRISHNERTGTSLKGGGTLEKPDLEAFCTLYDEALASVMKIEVDALAGERSALAFVEPKAIGVGNRFNVAPGPDTAAMLSKSKRRVDLVFFETAHPIPDLTVEPAGSRAFDARRARLFFLPPEPPPPVSSVRVSGLFFDTNKCFLLPSAMRGIRKLVELYAEHPKGEVLVIGHTDTVGRPAYNDTLSLERAKAVAAYLRDDFEAWLAFYGDDKPELKRWGSLEDQEMLGALPDSATHLASQNPIKSYQAARGLNADGIAGKNTRTQLIKDYMAIDGTTLPPGVTPVAHGCGESFPIVKSGDEVEQDENRRAELFVFDEKIDPPPPGEISKPGSTEYEKWRGQVIREIRIVAQPDPRLEVRLHDEHSKPMSKAPFRVLLGESVLAAGVADGKGFAVFALPPVCPPELIVEWGRDIEDGDFLFQRAIQVECNEGDVDSVTRARLQNLGYDVLKDLDVAVQRFQQDYKVDHKPQPIGLVGGAVPPATQAKIDSIVIELECDATTPGGA